MRALRHSRRKAIGVSSLLLFSACLGDAIVQAPGAGGIQNSPGSCATGPLNTAWTNARLSGNRTLPVKCPYNVNVPNQTITLAAELFGPKSTTSLNGSATLGPVRSKSDSWVVAPSQSAYWGDDPNNSSGRRLTFTVNYQGGHYPAGGPGPWSKDSGVVVVDGTTYGQAQAYLTLSGSATVAPGFLIVPSTVVSGSTAQFRAVTTVDTTSYSFSWNVDGASVGNDHARLATTFMAPGSHQVTAYATNAAGGVLTMGATFTVALNVNISGTQSAKPGSSITYNAVIGAGGTAPYTYSWLVDGSQVSTASSYRYTYGPVCRPHLQLTVTDAAGRSGNIAVDLFMIDPNC